MEKKVGKKLVVLREGGFVASVCSDTVTFAYICGTFWFNHAYIGGSYMVNAILLFVFLTWLISKSATKKYTFYSLEELQKWAANPKEKE